MQSGGDVRFMLCSQIRDLLRRGNTAYRSRRVPKKRLSQSNRISQLEINNTHDWIKIKFRQ